MHLAPCDAGLTQNPAALCPDPPDGTADTDEQSCRCQDNKCQQQCVLDEILSLLALQQISNIALQRLFFLQYQNVVREAGNATLPW